MPISNCNFVVTILCINHSDWYIRFKVNAYNILIIITPNSLVPTSIIEKIGYIPDRKTSWPGSVHRIKPLVHVEVGMSFRDEFLNQTNKCLHFYPHIRARESEILSTVLPPLWAALGSSEWHQGDLELAQETDMGVCFLHRVATESNSILYKVRKPSEL